MSENEYIEKAVQSWRDSQPAWFTDKYPNNLRSSEIKLRRINEHRYSIITPASDINELRKCLNNMGCKYSIHIDEKSGWAVSFGNLDDILMLETLYF